VLRTFSRGLTFALRRVSSLLTLTLVARSFPSSVFFPSGAPRPAPTPKTLLLQSATVRNFTCRMFLPVPSSKLSGSFSDVPSGIRTSHDSCRHVKTKRIRRLKRRDSPRIYRFSRIRHSLQLRNVARRCAALKKTVPDTRETVNAWGIRRLSAGSFFLHGGRICEFGFHFAHR